MIDRLRGRVFYGWVMVATGAVIQVMTGGLLNQSYGAYVVVLSSDMGWNKTTLAAAYSLVRFESDLLGPVEGWLIDRFGARVVMRAGLAIMGLGFMVISQVDSLVGFYVAFGVLALGSSLGGFFPLTVAVVQWFHRRRSTALSVMQTGFALGGMTVPIIVFCLETYGWRATAFASGVLVMVVGIPLAQLIRGRPEDYGLQVDGGPPRNAADGAPGRRTVVPADAVDFRLGEALRTSAFWLISLGHGSALLVVAAVLVHLVPHLHVYLGYSLAAAGFVVSLMTVMQIVGQLVGGVLGDRFSKRAICAVCMGMHATGLLMVAYATSTGMVIAFAVLHGLAWGMRGPMMQSIRADYFGRAAFGVIMGTSSLIVTIGNTSGPLIAGVLADQTGNYQAGFTVLALLAGLGSLFFVFAARPRPPARLREPTHTSPPVPFSEKGSL